jgi:hypothetical protein
MKYLIPKIRYFIVKLIRNTKTINTGLAIIDSISGTYYIESDKVVPQFGSDPINLVPNNKKYIGKIIDLTLLIPNERFDKTKIYHGVDFSYYP